MDNKNLKLAYLGGGSRFWARKLMCDLALEPDLCGIVYLYDIDGQGSKDNEFIGNTISKQKDALSKWKYVASESIEEALKECDFVVISILPGTFKEMGSDVHHPEKYGLIQTVGDTTGPGGYIRAMRCVPIFRYFAQKIRENCPNAWVINYTNPMTLCTRTLYEEFPQIKAFGCCHEVFGAQELLARVVEESMGLPKIKRQDISVDVCGINHFTWITEASYKGIDIMPLFKEFSKKYLEKGFITMGEEDAVIVCGNVIKFQQFLTHGVIAAAGDRHLAEFFSGKWYLKSTEQIRKNKFNFTPVSWRIEDLNQKIELSKEYLAGKKVNIEPSGEEGVLQMKALAGLQDMLTNINMPNSGQMLCYPDGAVVETNAVLRANSIVPIRAKQLPPAVNSHVIGHVNRQEAFIKAAFAKDLDLVIEIISADPQCQSLDREDCRKMILEMYDNTKSYLDFYWKS